MVKAGHCMCAKARDWLLLVENIDQLAFLKLLWSPTLHKRGVDELSLRGGSPNSGGCLLGPWCTDHTCVRGVKTCLLLAGLMGFVFLGTS